MILNDKEIRNRIINYKDFGMDYQMIDPFSEKQLQGASYDLTIDNEIYTIRSVNNVVDVKDQSQLDSLYEKVHVDSDGFLLMPYSYILVTLRETIYIPPELTAHLRPKTRFIRAGVLVSGQHINPDSLCKLNLGVVNLTSNPIRMYSNMSIAQVVFENMSDVPSSDKLYEKKKGSHYAHDIEFIGAKFTNELSDYIDGEIDRWLK